MKATKNLIMAVDPRWHPPHITLPGNTRAEQNTPRQSLHITGNSLIMWNKKPELMGKYFIPWVLLILWAATASDVLCSPGLSQFYISLTHALTYTVYSRRPVPSKDQALPSCFYFRISWISMERCCFYFFCPLGFLRGLRSLKHWLLQKLSMKNLDQQFKFLIKK